MSDFDLELFLQLDFPALAAGALAAMACAIVGSFLVLRRMSLMGDAISHAVLPGIIGAFVLTGSLSTWPVFVGCAIVGVLVAFASELVHRLGRVEPGASMGVVFTVFFAIGVIWLSQVEQQSGSTAHLDADCVLYGAMEGVIWPTPPIDDDGGIQFAALNDAATWDGFPRQVTTLLLVLIGNVMFLTVFFKELRITSFDPGLAASLGVNPGLLHYLLMVFVATTTVASFEAVGSILVVAMLIVPGLIAHLLTDRLWLLVVLSAVVALIASILGYIAASILAVNSAGMIGLTLGALLLVTGLLAPQHGWLSRGLRRLALATTIAREDMLGLLYRLSELAPHEAPPLGPTEIRAAVGGGMIGRAAWWSLQRRGEAEHQAAHITLTPTGLERARNLIRSHRLWESYLVTHLGLRPDHVHGTAMRLEHLTSADLQAQLADDLAAGERDPHGKEIPPA